VVRIAAVLDVEQLPLGGLVGAGAVVPFPAELRDVDVAGVIGEVDVEAPRVLPVGEGDREQPAFAVATADEPPDVEKGAPRLAVFQDLDDPSPLDDEEEAGRPLGPVRVGGRVERANRVEAKAALSLVSGRRRGQGAYGCEAGKPPAG